MAFIPAVNVIKAEMRFTYHGQKVENVYHLHKDGVVAGLADFDAIGEILVDWWTGDPQTWAMPDLSLDSIALTDLTTEDAGGSEYLLGLPAVGSNTGHSLPGNVTFAVKWLTASRGRSFRGRTYHIGLADGQIDGQQLGPTWLSSFIVSYNLLKSSFDDTAYDMAVVSYRHDNAPRETALITHITAASIDVNLDSQRRRLTGRGD